MRLRRGRLDRVPRLLGTHGVFADVGGASEHTRAAVDEADVIMLALGGGDVTTPPTSTRCPRRAAVSMP